MYNLDYLNSRLGAMKGELLEKKQVEALVGVEKSSEITSFFLGTPYAREVQQVSAALPPVERLDEALRRNLSSSVGKIYRISEEPARGLLEGVFFWWDLYNLKTVIRGKVANARPEDIFSALLPVGVLDEGALKELIQAPDIRDIAGIMALWGMPWGRHLRKTLSSWQREEGVARLEDDLERACIAESTGGVVAGGFNALLVKEFNGYMIDSVNLMFLLRHLRADHDLSGKGDYFIPGGSCLSRHDYNTLAGCPGYRAAMELLPRLRIYRKLRFAECRDLHHSPSLERWINLRALERVSKAGRNDPLSIGVLFDYLRRKIGEVINLRLVIRGREAGISTSELHEMLLAG